MEYKILEANGTENENVDGAAFNNFCSGGKNYVMKGILNECSVYSPSSNSIGISTGELVIQGFRIKILSPYFYSFTGEADTVTEYNIIARIRLKIDRSVEFELLCSERNEVEQEELYKTESGVYEVRIATFTRTLEGITAATITIPVGYPGNRSLPDVDQTDNGKILMVQNGVWSLVKIVTAEEGEV